jgi:Flp pilus assembly protein protease CpaA
MSAVPLLQFAPLIGFLLLAAFIDARQRRIPNWLTGGMILGGLLRGAIIGGWAGTGHAAAGVFGGAAAPLVLFMLGALGGGDVKLLAGIGAWLGPWPAFLVYVVQCLLALALILVQAAATGRTTALFRNSAVLACQFGQTGCDNRAFTSIDRPLPFAVPVAAATLVVLLAGDWMR